MGEFDLNCGSCVRVVLVVIALFNGQYWSGNGLRDFGRFAVWCECFFTVHLSRYAFGCVCGL